MMDHPAIAKVFDAGTTPQGQPYLVMEFVPGADHRLFACMAAITKHSEDALQYLEKAINGGFKDANRLLTDEDLKKLRGNPRFQQLVTELKANASSIQAK